MSCKTNRSRGYATATILIVVAILGSTALWSYREVLTGRTLANARFFQVRAASLAGIGLQAAASELRRQPAVTRLAWQQQAPGARDEQIGISTRLLRTETLPAGFSADRFLDYQHELTSTVSSGLGTQVARSMGVALLNARVGNAPPPGCPTAEPVPINVRIGGSSTAPVAAMLTTGSPTLGIVDRSTGRLLWSAGGPDAPTAQHLFDDRTHITGSVTVIDTDSDGLHDRIYAGDHAGRIWRLDLHNGSDGAHFAAGSIFAELADARVPRPFVAAPDVSMTIGTAGLAWLNIVIGSTGAGPNRIFVLRDYAARQLWSDAEHQRWRPLRAADLHADGPAADVAEPAGYYFDLGQSQVFTPSITVDGAATYLAAETAIRVANGCNTRISIGKFNVASGASAARHAYGDAAAGIALRALAGGTPHRGRIRCMLADDEVAQCSGFDPLRRSWWRRADAD